MRNGRISSVGEGEGPKDPNYERIDAKGGFITPGLIDVHSHAGVSSFPLDGAGNSDTNEMTDSHFPAVRAIDAFNPNDELLKDILSGGVTTLQVLPGSGNVMGGQGVTVKLRGNTVEEMRIKNIPITLKMACGENPKRIYGNKGVTPMSRLGVGYKMREAFFEAAKLLQAQKDYCDNKYSQGAFPRDIYYDNLIELLRGRALLNIHCYKVVDFEMALRVTSEFGINIDIFHHAHEAHLISNILKERNISVALFSDNFAYKLEAYEGTVHAPRILDEAGVNVLIKTDHPVVQGKDLLYEVQKSAHYGLNPDSALESVTLNAARALKLDYRIGSIATGKDADIVIWDRHPLHLGAQPTHIFIEGHLVKKTERTIRTDLMTYESPYQKWKMSTTPNNICSNIDDNNNKLSRYSITNANIYTGSTYIENGEIVVSNGIIQCAKKTCNVDSNYPIFDMKNGTITPGSILTSLSIGLIEIDQEGSWNDGRSRGDLNTSTINGVTIDSKHVAAAWNDGVLTVIARPFNSKVLSGAAGAYNIGPGINVLENKYIVDEYASIDIQLGNIVKSDISSISGQFQLLKEQFEKAKDSDGPLKRVIDGNIPVVFWVESADQIASLFRVLNETIGQENSNMKIILGGASESHLVVDDIKRWGASVLARRCTADGFETRRCNFEANIKSFLTNDIKFGIIPAEHDHSLLRGIRWEAGLTKEFGASQEKAIASITSAISE